VPILTPTLSLCDQLVSIIGASWNPVGPSAVQRVYFMRQVAKDLAGRQVWVFPTNYGISAENRSENAVRHRVSVLTAEKYGDINTAGLPPTAWIDTRVDFVFTTIVDGLYFAQGGPLVFGSRRVWTAGAEVEVCDLEKITTTPAVFWSLVDLEFEELYTA